MVFHFRACISCIFRLAGFVDLESKSDKSKSEVLSNVIPIYSILRNRNSWYFDFSVLSLSQISCVCFVTIFSLQEFSVFGFLIIWYSHKVGFSHISFSVFEILSFEILSFGIPRKKFLVLSFSVSCVNHF